MKPTAHAYQHRAARFLPAALAGAGIALLAGCGSETIAPVPPPAVPPQQTVVVAPTPIAAAPQTAVIGTTPSGQIVVTQAPPVSMQQQVIGARPSADHVWVEGWWVWRDGRYEWRPGEWVVPPRRGAVWVPPRWERRDDGYAFVEGYWQ
jgi:hypothetical protein